MKKVYIIMILILCSILLNCTYGCIAILYGIPIGFKDKEEYYDEQGFREYTDYAKYIYSSKSIITNNRKYEIITNDNIDNVKSFFSDFSLSMREELEDVYNFDENIITVGDYVRIKDVKEYPSNLPTLYKYHSYTIYYFDVDTLTLYYIHKNF